MAKPKTDPMFVHLSGPIDLIEAVEGDYRVSTREVCRSLMCSRGHVDRVVKPSIHHIYATRNSRYVQNGTYYSSSELAAVAAQGTVERRTAAVWPEEIVSDPAAVLKLRAQLGETLRTYKKPPIKAVREYRRELVELVRADALPAWRAAATAFASPTKRGGTPWIDLGDPTPPAFEADEGLVGLPTGGELAGRWRTAADMMVYGDTDEQIHREVWSKCMCRLTLSFGQGDERVMYAPTELPPWPLPDSPPADGWTHVLPVPVYLAPKQWAMGLPKRAPIL